MPEKNYLMMTMMMMIYKKVQWTYIEVVRNVLRFITSAFSLLK